MVPVPACQKRRMKESPCKNTRELLPDSSVFLRMPAAGVRARMAFPPSRPSSLPPSPIPPPAVSVDFESGSCDRSALGAEQGLNLRVRRPEVQDALKALRAYLCLVAQDEGEEEEEGGGGGRRRREEEEEFIHNRARARRDP